MNNTSDFLLFNVPLHFLTLKSKKARVFAMLLLSGVLLTCASFVTHAKMIEHVNVGRIKVEDQSFRSQQIAGKRALEQVFIKVSGSVSIASNEAVDRAIENYEQYLISSSFQYEGNDQYLVAQFNQSRIESLLLASGLPVWTNIRPTAMLWLAYNSELSNERSSQIIITQNKAHEIAADIKNTSFARGVEVSLPLGDFEDTVNISYFDVANHHLSKIRNSSTRYQPDYIISASLEKIDAKQAQEAQQMLIREKRSISRLDPSNSLFKPSLSDRGNSNVSLIEQSSRQNADQSRLTMDIESLVEAPIPDNAQYKLDYVIARKTDFGHQLLSTGRFYETDANNSVIELIEIYANLLALEFSLSTQESSFINQYNIVVSSIDSLHDYLELMELFQSIPAVENVFLVSQKGRASSFKIEQKISIPQLISILSLDNRLTIISGKLDEQDTVFLDWQK